MSKLYDRDFFEWTREQGALLRRREAERANEPLDYENLAEEIESLGRSDLRALSARIERIVEHLLKLEHSPSERPRAGWRQSVRTQRARANRLLRDSPSLRPKLPEEMAEIYEEARANAADSVGRDGLASSALPKECPYSLEQVLDRSWLPANRHGLP